MRGKLRKKKRRKIKGGEKRRNKGGRKLIWERKMWEESIREREES